MTTVLKLVLLYAATAIVIFVYATTGDGVSSKVHFEYQDF